MSRRDTVLFPPLLKPLLSVRGGVGYGLLTPVVTLRSCRFRVESGGDPILSGHPFEPPSVLNFEIEPDVCTDFGTNNIGEETP